MTMAAGERPGSLVAEAVGSLEVRWIFPGPLEAAVAGWFTRFLAGTEPREDIYLLDPQLRGLSVKIRGAAALEVKMYHGSPGIVEVARRARGPGGMAEVVLPHQPAPPGQRHPAGWRPVGKRRRISRFMQPGGQIVTPATGLGHEPGARWNSPRSTWVARTGGRWASKRPAPPNCSAANSRPLSRSCSPRHCPVAWNPAWRDSRSYAQWLRQQADAKSNADA